jgi:hypothetical protein
MHSSHPRACYILCQSYPPWYMKIPSMYFNLEHCIQIVEIAHFLLLLLKWMYFPLNVFGTVVCLIAISVIQFWQFLWNKITQSMRKFYVLPDQSAKNNIYTLHLFARPRVPPPTTYWVSEWCLCIQMESGYERSKLPNINILRGVAVTLTPTPRGTFQTRQEWV